MKGSIIITTVAMALTMGMTVAGERTYRASAAYSSKGGPVTIKPTANCDCFEAGPQISLFAAGIIGGGGGGGHYGGQEGLDDGFGAGFSGAYFFTEHFGLEGSAMWLSNDNAIHAFDLSAVARLPIEELCLAPYVYGGGGIHTNSVTQGTAHVGGGVDFRFDNFGCNGLFVDARYTFAESTDDYTIVRAGVRWDF